MFKKREFSVIKVFILIIGILSIILPWCAIGFGKGFKIYILYFFFGLITVGSHSPAIWNPYTFIPIGFPYFPPSHESLSIPYLLIIPALIYIIGLIFSLSNTKVNGRYTHGNLAAIGFTLMLCSILIYYLVIPIMILTFLHDNRGFNFKNFEVIPIYGTYTASISALLALIEFIFCIRNRKQIQYVLEAKTIACPNCTYMNPTNNKYCGKCGDNLKSEPIVSKAIVLFWFLFSGVALYSLVTFLLVTGTPKLESFQSLIQLILLVLTLTSMAIGIGKLKELKENKLKMGVIKDLKYDKPLVIYICFIGGLLLISTLFLPTAYSKTKLWGEIYVFGWNSKDFKNFFEFFFSLILGVVILFSGIFAIYHTNEIRNSDKKWEQYSIILLIWAVLPILMIIIFFIHFQYYKLIPSFGIYLALIGSILIFIGIIIGKLEQLKQKSQNGL